jgi:hypothetical protein
MVIGKKKLNQPETGKKLLTHKINKYGHAN